MVDLGPGQRVVLGEDGPANGVGRGSHAAIDVEREHGGIRPGSAVVCRLAKGASRGCRGLRNPAYLRPRPPLLLPPQGAGRGRHWRAEYQALLRTVSVSSDVVTCQGPSSTVRNVPSGLSTLTTRLSGS